MERNIINKEKISLSDKDILHITDNKCNVMTYLLNYKTLDHALGKYGAFCVLYETNDQGNYGHWVAVIKIGNDLIEFFDSLSSKPDKEWAKIAEQYRKNPYLSHLMKESSYKLSYNQYHFQKPKANTCGRHCALRIVLKEFPLEKYKNAITNPKFDYDFMVTGLTELLL